MNFRKKWEEKAPEEDTAVWSCTEDNCNGWMRDNFRFESEPRCPLCSAPMESEIRSLPTLVNYVSFR
ncbi:cold-shock protein [Paenibacillus alkalitolerans]|uniref:cold-shock protein n=1 Tax=Paenibacillus alkalitolerans TaxID=2799335 RepID=UPI0018F6E3BA|nr:cold-shock protein [Paenibacillus alkalitolerans]